MSATASVDALGVDDLGRIGDVIGSGGQAVVYDLPELTLPDAPGRLVFKKYRAGQEPHPSPMHQLIGRRLDLSASQRGKLDSLATWPLRAVMDEARLRGVVLARIPDAFYQDTVMPSGCARIDIREVQHLFVDPVRSRRIGMPEPGFEERLRICRDFAAAVDFLHSEVDVVFGDINARNEVFRIDDSPMVMFVDCDAARRRGAVGTQLNTPDWEPGGAAMQSRSTDCYKLGLFVLRCLTPGPQCSTQRNPAVARGVLDDEGLDLLSRALIGPSDVRPSARAWWRYLSLCLGEMIEVPEMVSVSAGRTLVAAGEMLPVHWVARHGQVVEVESAETVLAACDCDGESGAVEVAPLRTGRLTVTVRNNLGAVSARTEPVAVLEPLPRQAFPVPAPQPPELGWGPGSLPDLSSALPPPVPVLPSDMPAPTFGSLSPAPAVALASLAATDCPIDVAAFLGDAPYLTPTIWEAPR